MARSIMIQGTMSNVGKSFLTAGLCRIFKQDGYQTAPFKAQNMALNSYITAEGLEMGRAQVMQAEAAGIVPSVLMNPVLLKPTTEMGSQVIVNGEVRGQMSAADYFACKKELIPEIKRAYDTLAAEYDIIVLEGAGSPAEINLKKDDIVNMGMAQLAGAPVLLVGDIDRGGVFAQLAGTVSLLEDAEQRRIKGLVMNKFRGDKMLLEPGIPMLYEHCQIPVVGIVPYMKVELEDEDSLSGQLCRRDRHGEVDIAVILFPKISNFTDFHALEITPPFSVRYVSRLRELGRPDLIILPGTKNTMEDLKWFRSSGLLKEVRRLSEEGTLIFGICGGYQMLGMTLEDPEGTEGGGSMCGMGLLKIRTVFAKEKIRTRVTGTTAELQGAYEPLSFVPFEGYEIHMGKAYLEGEEGAFAMLQCGKEQKSEGACTDTVCGTFVHGIFDSIQIRKALQQILCSRKGIEYGEIHFEDYTEYKERQYDRLAEELRKSLDMDKIYQILEEGAEKK